MTGGANKGHFLPRNPLGQAMGAEAMPALPVVPWTTAGPPVELPTVHDPDADVLLGQLVGLIQLGAATSPRSVQTSIGSSEVGYTCDRRIAYKLAGTKRANLDDPVRTLVGLGLHGVFADLFGRLADGSQRFWTEVHELYREVPGQLDLYDRFLSTVVDFKTTTKSKIVRLRKDGPPRHYVVQVQLYGAGLTVLGEIPKAVALLYVPIDGTLEDCWAWRTPFNQRIADEAVDRIERLRGKDPSTVDAHADRLCPWCAHFRPGSTDLALGCPGNT